MQVVEDNQHISTFKFNNLCSVYVKVHLKNKSNKRSVMYIKNVNGEATGVTETMKEVTFVTKTHQVLFQITFTLIKLCFSFEYTINDVKTFLQTVLVNLNRHFL